METQFTIEEILVLGAIPETLHTAFLRVANGLLQRAEYPKEKVLQVLAQLLVSPKKYAYSKNKVTNLAQAVYKLRQEGQVIELSEEGKSYLPAPEPAYTLSTDKKQQVVDFELRQGPLPYVIFGREYIEQGALDQMQTAASLPISVAGALMPDSHQGYGLPIGGVLATEANTVIPFAVGVDIACRMCMSILICPPIF
jgi:tRNA-splicing ligase RtcB